MNDLYLLTFARYLFGCSLDSKGDIFKKGWNLGIFIGEKRCQTLIG